MMNGYYRKDSLMFDDLTPLDAILLTVGMKVYRVVILYTLFGGYLYEEV